MIHLDPPWPGAIVGPLGPALVACGRWLVVGAGLAVGLFGGGCEEVRRVEQQPTPPSLAGLVAAYQEPAADLLPASVPDLLIQLEQRRTPIEKMNRFAYVTDKALRVAFETAKSTEGRGYLIAHRICDGWEAAPTADEEVNGYVALTLNYEDDDVEPVVWGDLVDCRYTSGGRRYLLDGSVRLHVGEGITWDTLGHEPLLVAFTGRYGIDEGAAQELDLDFRLLPRDQGSQLEIRLPLGEGGLSYYERSDDSGFRAHNGTWSCNFELQSCRDDSGGTISW